MDRSSTKTKLGCFDNGNNSGKVSLSDFGEINKAAELLTELAGLRKDLCGLLDSNWKTHTISEVKG